MPESLKKLRIFAASPSDVASERAKLETVSVLLKPITDYLGLIIEVLDWRTVVPDAGRPQQIIFDQLRPTSWDIFIGILWHRFGTPPGGKDPLTQQDYLSGTEEEFRTAYRLWKEFGKPRIVMYRCTRPIPVDVDFVQAQRIKDFFKEIQSPQNDFRVLSQSFDTLESFEKLWLDNLQKLLIEYSEQSKTPVTSEVAQILAPIIPNNLPNRAPFFGRTKEMEIVMSALSPMDRTWGVLVDGIGGSGKSALAIEAAHRAREGGAFDAFVYVSAKQNILEPSGIHEQIPAAHTLDEFLNETARVLNQIGITKLVSLEKRHALLDVLRGTRTLLIYDNLETLSKEEQEAMADFLRELPQGCKAIITSRRRTGEGAVWLRIEQLDWDAARGIIENEIAHDSELANKLRYIEARWKELFDATSGSALALVHILGLMRIRVALTFEDALEMLLGSRDEDLQKFIFQEAHKELTDNDIVALGALSFFVPSAPFEAWMEVAELSRNILETTIDRLSALSLVNVLTGEERYSLHPLTRAFVRNELLASANEAHETGMRFARYWVDYAERYGGSSRNYATYVRVETEWTNLDAAANWLWEISGPQNGDDRNEVAGHMLNNLAEALSRFLWYSGRWDDRIELEGRAYDVTYTMNNWQGAGWRAYRVALIYHYRGNIDNATLWADKCSKAWSNTKSNYLEAISKRIQGLVAQQRQEYDRAERLFNEALKIRRDLGTDRDISISLNDLGMIRQEQKDYALAEHYFLDAIELARKIDGKWEQAEFVGNIGEIALLGKRLDNAQARFQEQISIAREIGRVDLIANAQYGLARVHKAKGFVNLALPLALDALKIYERLRHKDLAQVREFVEMLKKAEE